MLKEVLHTTFIRIGLERKCNDIKDFKKGDSVYYEENNYRFYHSCFFISVFS